VAEVEAEIQGQPIRKSPLAKTTSGIKSKRRFP